jgi:hypothetical protein
MVAICLAAVPAVRRQLSALTAPRILDVGSGIKGGSPEKPQFVGQLHFNHNELYGNGWLAGTHSVFRYKNYVFIGDEVFPGRFDLSRLDRIRCVAS